MKVRGENTVKAGMGFFVLNLNYFLCLGLQSSMSGLAVKVSKNDSTASDYRSSPVSCLQL